MNVSKEKIYWVNYFHTLGHINMSTPQEVYFIYSMQYSEEFKMFKIADININITVYSLMV